jgi:hypothetical protein
MSGQLKAFIAFAWLFTVSIAYYLLYPAGTALSGLLFPHMFRPAVYPLWNTLTLILFFSSALGWGKPFLGKATATKLEGVLFAAAAGFGVIAFLVLAAGMTGITSVYFYLLVIACGFLLLVTDPAALRWHARHSLKLLVLVSLLPLGSSLLAALAPPTQFDSLVYHLALPARYLSAGKFHFIDHNIFFSFPQNMEMLFQSALALQGDTFANLLSWLFFLLTGLAIFSFGRRFFGRATAVVSGALWYFTPAAMFLATGTYIDIALTYYIFLSFYALALWRESGRTFWLYASGFMGGLACGTKYTAAAALLILFFMLLFYYRDLRSACRFLLSAFIPFAPWLIKNALFIKNPLAPWAVSLFPGSRISLEVATGYLQHIHAHGAPLATIIDLIALPWKLTAYGFQFGGAFDIMGPIFLLFIPLLFLTAKIDKIKLVLFVFSAGFVIVWLFTGKVLRFLIPVFPMACILAALGFVQLYRSGFAARCAAITVLLAALGHNLLMFHWVMSGIEPFSPVLGGEGRSHYLGRKVNSFNAVSVLNSLPGNGAAVFWGETRAYFCRKPAIVPTVFDRHPLADLANTSTSPAGLAAALHEKNIDYLLVDDFEVRRLSMENLLTSGGKTNLESMTEKFATLKYQDRNCRLYELNTPVPPKQLPSSS